MKNRKNLLVLIIMMAVALMGGTGFFVSRKTEKVYAAAEIPSVASQLYEVDTSGSSLSMSTTKLASADSSYFCWRDYGLIYTEDQDGMGLCWAYTSMKALEGAMFLKYGEYYNFSEAWAGLAATYNQGTSFGFGHDYSIALNFLKQYGVILETDMPNDIMLNIGDNNKNELFDFYSQYANKDIFKVLEANEVVLTKDDNTDIKLVKQALIEKGMLYSAIEFYRFVDDTYIVTDVTDDDDGHAVTIIGWDDNISVGGYTGCFIALNSWNNSWGNDGVFYVPYELVGSTLDTVAYFYFNENEVEVNLSDYEYKTLHSSGITYNNQVYNVGKYSNASVNNDAEIITNKSLQRNVVIPGFGINNIYQIKNNTDSNISIQKVEVIYNTIDKTNAYKLTYPSSVPANSSVELKVYNSAVSDTDFGFHKIIIYFDYNNDGITDFKEVKHYYLKDDAGIEAIHARYKIGNTLKSMGGNHQVENLYLSNNNITMYLPGTEVIEIIPSTYSTIFDVKVYIDEFDNDVNLNYFNPASIDMKTYASGVIYISTFDFEESNNIEIRIGYYAQSFTANKIYPKTKTIKIKSSRTEDDDGQSFDYNSSHFTKIFHVVDNNTQIASKYINTSYNYTGDVILNTPKKEGYTFAGWFFDKALTESVPLKSGKYCVTPSLYSPSSIDDLSEYIKFVGYNYRTRSSKEENDRKYTYYMMVYPMWEKDSEDIYIVTAEIEGVKDQICNKAIYVNGKNFDSNVSISMEFIKDECVVLNFKKVSSLFVEILGYNIVYGTKTCSFNFDLQKELEITICKLENNITIIPIIKSLVHKLYLTYDTTYYSLESLNIFKTYYFVDGLPNIYIDEYCTTPLTEFGSTEKRAVWPNLPILNKTGFTFGGWCTYPKYHIVDGNQKPTMSASDWNTPFNSNGEFMHDDFDGPGSTLYFGNFSACFTSTAFCFHGDIILFPVLTVDSSKVHKLKLATFSVYDNDKTIAENNAELSIFKTYYYIADRELLQIYEDEACLKNVSSLPIQEKYVDIFEGWEFFPSYYYENDEFKIYEYANDKTSKLTNENGLILKHEDITVNRVGPPIADENMDLSNDNWYQTYITYGFIVETDVVLYPILNDESNSGLRLVYNDGVNGDYRDSFTIKEKKVLETPTRTGHIFKGWQVSGIEAEAGESIVGEIFDDATNNRKHITNGDVVDTISAGSFGDITLTALWEENFVTVDFVTNSSSFGKVNPLSITVPSGSRITISGNMLVIDDRTVIAEPTDTAQYDREFERWSGVVNGDEVTRNITITAIFTSVIKKYDVTIKTNNPAYGKLQTSSGIGDETKIINVEYGTAIQVSGSTLTIYISEVTATPATSDEQYTYSFKNWTIDGSAATGSTKTVTGNTTITANFERITNEYDVTFYNYDGTEIETKTVMHGESAVGLVETPSREDSEGYSYTFDKWVDIDGNEVNLTEILSDLNVYANYTATAIPYIIKFEENDGDEISDITYTIESETKVLPEGTRKGYKFDGWYNNNGFTDGPIVEVSTGSTGNKTFYAKWLKVVSIPEQAVVYYTYTGSVITHTPENFDSDTMEIINNTGTNAGEYFATVSLKDVDNTIWSDDTNESKQYKFVIKKVQLVKPTIDESEIYTYNGEEQTLKLKDFNDSLMTIENNTRTVAGSQTVTVKLNDASNYAWSDGTIADLTFTFTITKAQLTKPTAVSKTYTYDGQVQTFELNDFDSNLMTIENNTRTVAGSQTVTVKLNDASNYAWSDGSIDDLTFTFTITKAQLVKPEPNENTFTYNGSEQTYTPDEFDASTMNIFGNKQINADTYEVIVSILDTTNYEWNDGTTENLTFEFKIDKKLLTVTVQNITVTYGDDAPVYTCIYSGFVDGEDESVLTTRPTISCSYTSTSPVGEYKITASGAEAENYWFEYVDGTLNVVANGKIVKPTAVSKTYTYDGQVQTFELNDFNDSLMTVENNTRTVTGSQTVTVKLKDTTNYAWSDGSIDDLTFTFTITKAQLTKPTANENTFTYNGSEQTYIPAGFDSSTMSISGNEQTNADTYEVVVSILDTNNYEWSDGSIAGLKFQFEIKQASLIIKAKSYEIKYGAEAPDYEIEYIGFVNGETKNVLSKLPTTTCEYEKGDVVGDYVIVVNGAETQNYDIKHENGTLKVVPNGAIEKPDAVSKTYTYNGTLQTFELINFDSSLMTVEDDKMTNAGSQIVRVKLKDASNYTWSDRTTTDVTFTFTINKAQLVKPTASEEVFTYNGSEQTYIPDGFDSSTMSISGNEQTNADTYEVVVSILDTSNYEWSDGSIAGLKFDFVINKYWIAINPTPVTTDFTYTGVEQEFKFNNFDDSLMTVENNTRTNAGSQIVIVELKDASNYSWSDGTTGELQFTFSIKKLRLEKPTDNLTIFTYNGEEQKYFPIGYVSGPMKIARNIQTDAGIYTVKVMIVNTSNCLWSDGTIEALEFDFEIKKVSLIIKAKSYEIKYGAEAPDYEIEYDGFIEGENESVLTAQPIINCEYEKTSPVDKYSIIPSGASAKNYEITYKKGVLNVVPDSTIEKPEAVLKTYTYDGTLQTFELINFDSNLMTVEDDKMTNAGSQTVRVKLKDDSNYTWSDGTTTDVTFTFTINKAQLVKPTASEEVFTYNGSEQTYIPDGFDPSTMSISGNVQTNADTYEVVVSILDTSNHEWSDGSIAGLKFEFVINKYWIAINPTPVTTDFTYTGVEQEFKFNNFDDSLMTVENSKMTDADTKTVIVKLNDASNYSWSGGTTDDLTFTFTINKAQLVKPTASEEVFTYNGDIQTYIPDGFDPSTMSISGNVQTNADTYEVVVSILDTSNHEWSDGSIAGLKFEFVINKYWIAINPTPVTTDFTYTGVEQEFKFNNFDDSLMTVENSKMTDADTKTVIVKLNDASNYSWSDGTTDDLTFTFTINKAQLVKPTASEEVFTYNGSEQTYIPDGFDPSTMSISGNFEKNAGKYTIIISLKDTYNYKWINESVEDDIDPVVFENGFIINKASLKVAVVNEEICYGENKQEYETTIEGFVNNETYDTVFADEQKIGVSCDYDVLYPEKRNAGEYDIILSGPQEITNYVITYENSAAKLTVNKKELIITANDYTITAGSDAPNYGYKVDSSCLVYGESVAEVLAGVTIILSCSYDSINPVVYNYEISIIAKNSNQEPISELKNYTLTFVKGVLVVTENSFIIKPIQVSSVQYVYNGEEQAMQFGGLNESYIDNVYSISNYKQTNAGVYKVIISLCNKVAFKWEGGTTEDLIFEFKIEKATLQVTARSYEIKYGDEMPKLGYSFSGLQGNDDPKELFTGETSINLSCSYANNNLVGKYEICFDKSNQHYNSKLLNYNVTLVNGYLTVNEKEITKPNADLTKFTYNGSEQTYNPVGFDEISMGISNNKQTNANPNAYKVTVYLKDNNNYKWSDGTKNEIYFDFVINKFRIENNPTPKKTEFNFTSVEQLFELNYIDDGLMIVENDRMLNSGTQKVIVKLKDSLNYEWNDGSIADLKFDFEIKPITLKIDVTARKEYDGEPINSDDIYIKVVKQDDELLYDLVENLNNQFDLNGNSFSIILNKINSNIEAQYQNYVRVCEIDNVKFNTSYTIYDNLGETVGLNNFDIQINSSIFSITPKENAIYYDGVNEANNMPYSLYVIIENGSYDRENLTIEIEDVLTSELEEKINSDKISIEDAKLIVFKYNNQKIDDLSVNSVYMLKKNVAQINIYIEKEGSYNRVLQERPENGLYCVYNVSELGSIYIANFSNKDSSLLIILGISLPLVVIFVIIIISSIITIKYRKKHLTKKENVALSKMMLDEYNNKK